MKRSKINIEDIAAYHNLVSAFYKAAKGKRERSGTQAFLRDFDLNVLKLREDILSGKAPVGKYHRFTIFDPKKRTIHAACFPDRVLHHAVINFIGPVLERALVPSTFACRPGKGPLAAVHWVRHCMRRFPWYVKVDIKRYFDSIDHALLEDLLKRRLKGEEALNLVAAIIHSYRTQPGKGLPIGSLTSQHFANYYLDGLDRFLLEELKVSAHARYMDDFIWWCPDRSTAKKCRMAVEQWLFHHRSLHLNENRQLNRSSCGVTFCGFRVFPGIILLSKRKRKRYVQNREKWEYAYQCGQIHALELQSAYSSIYSSTGIANGKQWRQAELQRHPAPEVF